MKANPTSLVAGLILFMSGLNAAFSQTGPEFINCPASPLSLCMNDPGVRLPLNNQIYSSESDTNATSCSVHITQSIKVKSNCGHQLQYGVQLFLDDTSTAYTLVPLKEVTINSIDEAELIFDSELSPVNFIGENGIPYTSGCNPYHRVKWFVIDSCGEFATCEVLMELYDCATPIDTTSVPVTAIPFPLGGQITLFAKDFARNITDDCSSFEDLLFSFKPEEYMPSMLYVCNFPGFGIEIPSTLWIADKGKDVNCDGSISWEERNISPYPFTILFLDNGVNDCFKPDGVQISGKIFTNDSKPIELVSVNLTSPGHVFPTYITTQNGEYNFNHVVVPADVTITADRDDNHRNGVTTLDMVKIQKHLLGKEIITSPYDLIAADANNSQNVSAIDLVELRKLILGVYTKLPNNKSWRFVAKDYVFSDTTYPWIHADEITLHVIGDTANQDFIGIKVGDINHTAKASLQSLITREAYPQVALTIPAMHYEANEIIDINFSLADLESFDGFQFTLSSPDLEFLGVSSTMIDLTEDDYAFFGDKMTFSWFSLDEIINHDDDIVFTVKAITKRVGELKQSLEINSDITEAELYSGSEKVFTPKLVTNKMDGDQLTVYASEPNPWSTQCAIPFSLKEGSNVVLTVYNTDGNMVFREEKFYTSGYHDITLKASDFREEGLLFYTLQSENEQQMGKMILIK